MNTLDKISAFAVSPDEQWLWAGTIGGDLFSVRVDDLLLRAVAHGHAGGIETVAVHPTLPYLATLAIDYTIVLWDRTDPARPRKLQTLRLRDVKADGYDFVATLPLSCPLAFHPRERRLLTHSASGALTEIDFDDHTWRPRWAVGLFQDEDGTAYDIDYVRYLEGDERIFASTFGGHLAVVDPAAPHAPPLRYRYDRRTIHCAAHLTGTEYLLASDTRRVIRFDASGAREPVVGPTVVRDHLEQVVINPTSGRVFASSFDRTVVEVDPETLARRAVVLETPFKLRWIHTFASAPDTLVVQCRNGALYKVDLATKRCTGVLKRTPNALWTGVRVSATELAIAGEGPEMLRARVTGVDPETRDTRLAPEWIRLDAPGGAYVKRMVVHEPSGALVQARSDGAIVAVRGRHSRIIARLPSPLRDLAVSPDGHDVFAVTEDGAAWRIDYESGRTKAHFRTEEEPLWSLAYNPARRLLAVSERQGKLHLLDADTLTARQTAVEGTWAPKRMRWRGDDQLLVGRGAELYALDVATGAMDNVIPHLGNTIEDFAWDDSGRYLAACTYARRVHIFDLATWAELDVTGFDLDFPKGLLWLAPERAEGAHPYELVVFGRSGMAYGYRVHDERLQHGGPITRARSTPIWDAAGVCVL